MAGKSVDDYWNTSSNTSFNFDDESEHERRPYDFHELFDSNTDSIFSLSLEDSSNYSILPIHSIISKGNLDLVLDDVQMPFAGLIPPVQETIIKMFLGKPCVLNVYHTIEQKLELLDEAIATDDGNVILGVLLYLKKSLKLLTLYQHLSKRKIALQHYIAYLIYDRNLKELVQVYEATGNNSDLLYVYYIGAKDICVNEHLYTQLLNFLANYQSSLNSDKVLMFADYKNFLKSQFDLNQTNTSVMEHLAFLCKSEFEKGAENIKTNSSIAQFKQLLKISDIQYEWILLNTLSSLKMWKKLVTIFLKQNWLTRKNNIKSVINSELFVSTMHRHEAPADILHDFLLCVVDVEIGLSLAKKMGCHKYVIDVLINQKDRVAIINYKPNIPSQTEEYFYAESALQSTDKKWKN